MSPRTQKQFQAIRKEKKAKIKEVALELFANEGFHSTTISNLANKVGISKGLIYNYFESKEDIVHEILNDGIQKMLGGLDSNNDGVLERHEMENYLQEIFDILKANPEFWKLYFSISLQPAIFDLVHDKFEKLSKPIFTMVSNYFSEIGVEDPETETMIFIALLDGVGFHFIMEPESYPIEKVKQTLINRYVKYLKK